MIYACRLSQAPRRYGCCEKKKVSAASRETLASSHGAAYPCFIPRPTGGAVSGEIGLHAPSHELRPRPAFIHGRANVITAE